MSTAHAIEAHPDRARALEQAGAEVEALPTDGLDPALVRLGSRGITSLLVEGGPELQRGFLTAGLVDAWQMYVSPVVLGDNGVRWLDASELKLSLHPARVRILGADVRVDIDVHGTD